MKTTAIQVKDLTKVFGSGHTLIKAVTNVSFSIKKGEIVLIMGPSGSGKTTLLTMVGALLTPDSGVITLGGENISKSKVKDLAKFRYKNIGFIFQAFNLLSALTAQENVQIAGELNYKENKKVKNKAMSLLASLGLAGRMNNLPKELSGGEKQRVSIARALMNDPELILADEPTANLDSKSGHQVMEILRKIAKKQNKTVIIVSHDQRIMDIADRVLWLEDGRLNEGEVQLVIDPICGMKLRKDQAVFKSKYKGKEYYFCASREKELFNKSPQKYI